MREVREQYDDSQSRAYVPGQSKTMQPKASLFY